MDRSNTFRKSAIDQLLKAVETNLTSTIETLLTSNDDLINHKYSQYLNKTIIQIAVSNFAKSVSRETILQLINHGADLYLHQPETNDQQTLHFATIGQNPVILETILDHLDENRVNDITRTKETALHLLIRDGEESDGFYECLELLINREDIDVNVEDKRGNTPVLLAVKKGYKEVVKRFLKKQIDLDNYPYKGETLRKIIENWELEIPNNNIARDFYKDLVRFLNRKDEDGFISLYNSIDYLDLDEREETFLQTACEKNLKKIVEFFILKGDIDKIGSINRMKPLEIAAENGYYAIFRKLLDKTEIIPNDLLIMLLQNTIYKANIECDHKRCLMYLLLKRKNVPMNPDKYGNTPLHYAVKYSDCEVVLNLLQRGASLVIKNQEGVMPIDDIYPQTLEKHLNRCIKTKNNPPCDRQSTVVKYQYDTLIGESGEMNAFLSISENDDLKRLLKHPVLSGFLHLKWLHMQWIFNINFLFYLFFIISLIGRVFIHPGFCYPLCITFVVLILRELIELFLAPKTYCKDFENYLELLLIILTGFIIFHPTYEYYKQISALAILLASVELMLLIGQYPLFATYIAVFKKVSWNFFKFILWSLTLLIGFTLGFYIIYHPENVKNDGNIENEETDFYTEPILSFTKTIIMLIGELDASSFELETPLNKTFFLIFIYLIPITLLNVLNGLAVSDIQTIKANAEIVSLIERINRIVYIEDMLLGDTFLSKIIRAFAQYCCCCKLYDQPIPEMIAKRVFLFPHTFKTNDIEMLLYYKGEICFSNSDDINQNQYDSKKDYNKISNVTNKSLKKVYMNSKVIKSTKEIVMMSLNSEKEVFRRNLDDVKRSIDEVFEEMHLKGGEKHLDILYGLNAFEMLI